MSTDDCRKSILQGRQVGIEYDGGKESGAREVHFHPAVDRHRERLAIDCYAARHARKAKRQIPTGADLTVVARETPCPTTRVAHVHLRKAGLRITSLRAGLYADNGEGGA